jgi:hypothetical protein
MVDRLSVAVAFLAGSMAFAADPPASEKPEEFTFLFWTDQEIDQGKGGDYSKCAPTIEAMNAIPGKPWPGASGRKVEKPDFVTSGGDSTGWPTSACVKSWEKICRELLKYPTRAVAGNHDSGGKAPSETFYNWLRKDAFVKKHASDNGMPAWTPPDAGTGIIPGIQYSFRHKGVVFLMQTPTYDMSGKSKPGFSPVFKPDLEWLTRELAKYDPETPKIVINHFNAASITNRADLDAIYEKNNVLLHFCGHWEKVQHWRFGKTDWVMDAGHRGDDGTFSVVRIGQKGIVVAHWVTKSGSWHDKTIVREIPPRW